MEGFKFVNKSSLKPYLDKISAIYPSEWLLDGTIMLSPSSEIAVGSYVILSSYDVYDKVRKAVEDHKELMKTPLWKVLNE